MNFIFVINDIDFGEEVYKVDDLLNLLLLKEKIWVYNRRTPNLKKINPGDRVMLYSAGKGRRHFIGTIEIAGKVQANLIKPSNSLEALLFEIFDLATPVKKVELWKVTVPIKSVIEKLSFITDKKNYGLFFRQATKLINDEDYSLIIKEKNELTDGGEVNG